MIDKTDALPDSPLASKGDGATAKDGASGGAHTADSDIASDIADDIPLYKPIDLSKAGVWRSQQIVKPVHHLNLMMT